MRTTSILGLALANRSTKLSTAILLADAANTCGATSGQMCIICLLLPRSCENTLAGIMHQMMACEKPASEKSKACKGSFYSA